MIINYTCTYDSLLSGGVYQTHGDKDSFIGMVVDIAQNFMRAPMLSGKIKRNGITVLRFDYDGFSSTFFSNSMERTITGIPMHEFWHYYRNTESKRYIDSHCHDDAGQDGGNEYVAEAALGVDGLQPAVCSQGLERAGESFSRDHLKD